MQGLQSCFLLTSEFLPTHFIEIAINVKSTDTGVISTLGHWVKRASFSWQVEEYQEESMEVGGTWRNLVSQSLFLRNGRGYVEKEDIYKPLTGSPANNQTIQRKIMGFC